MVFVKRKEDFICEKCGVKVEGNGYTNHCPACLWSKHVDIDPGDRLSMCLGLMKPARVEIEKGIMRLIHVCTKCGHSKPNKVLPEDSIDELAKISASAGEW